MKYELTSNSWGEEELEAAIQCLRSGRSTMGEQVRQFEKSFADRFRIPYAVMVSSGSMANLVGLAALFYKSRRPLQRGDEAIVPAISWATTYYPLQQYGLRLRFVDVELDTLNIDVSALEKALTPRTRMVVAVSILGNPCALDTLRQFCDQHGLILFEDNCESMGAELDGIPCGTFGDVGTFSFFFSHHISTMEGGMIVTADEEIYHLLLSLRAHGWTRNLPADTKVYQKNAEDFYEAYRFLFPGYNARPLEIAGAVGLQQLRKLDRMLEVRRRNAKVFQELFREDPRFIIQRENGKSSWFSFTIIIDPALARERRRILNILSECGIEFRIITGGNFLRHDVIRYFDYERVGQIVNADIAHDNGFFVGNHPRDIRAEIEYLRDVLDRVAR